MAMNNVNLIGRLTKDIELKKVGDNISTCSFTVAVDRTMSKKDRDAAQAAGKPTADFINCVAWRQTADILAQYAKKGSLLGVDGRLTSRSYANQAGQTVWVTELVCNNVQLLNTVQNTNQPQPQAPAPAPVSAPAVPEVNPAEYADITAEDLPF